MVTTAAREDNPEVLEAQRRGLRILPRSAGLAAVMAGSRVLAVAGTHGKTTTTGLLTSALLAAGLDPSYAVGGVLAATGRNADSSADDVFVADRDVLGRLAAQPWRVAVPVAEVMVRPATNAPTKRDVVTAGM